MGQFHINPGHGTTHADSGMIPAKPGWMTALHMSKKQKNRNIHEHINCVVSRHYIGHRLLQLRILLAA